MQRLIGKVETFQIVCCYCAGFFLKSMDVEASVSNWGAFLVCMPQISLLFHKHEREEERQATEDVYLLSLH